MKIGDEVRAGMWTRVNGVVVEINENARCSHLVRFDDDLQSQFCLPDRIWMMREHLCPTSIPWPPPDRVASSFECPSCGKETSGWCECGTAIMVGDEDHISFSGHRIDVGDDVDVWSRWFCKGVVMSDEKHGVRLVRIEGAEPPEMWYTIGSLEPIVSDVEEDSVQSIS